MRRRFDIAYYPRRELGEVDLEVGNLGTFYTGGAAGLGKRLNFLITFSS